MSTTVDADADIDIGEFVEAYNEEGFVDLCGTCVRGGTGDGDWT